MGCAPLPGTVGTRVLVGKFSSPPFYPSRWVASCPVFQHVMIQAGRAGAAIGCTAPAGKLLPVIDSMGSADNSAPSSELFPFLAAHKCLPQPWRLSQGSLANYASQAPSYLPGPLNRYEATKPSWLFQEVSTQQLQARLEAGVPCGHGGTSLHCLC